jgi:PAS domain S-box-containing protein
MTEIKEAEEKLAASEQRFRALIENSAEGISLTDEFSNVIYRSPAVPKITGSPLDERKENAVGYAHPEDLEIMKGKLRETTEKPGVPIPFEARFLHQLGHYYWLEGTVTNLFHVKGVEAVVANFRDITERKNAEEEILKLNAELEQKVMLRTKQLQEANKELEAFSYSVSHDLRAPLRIIDGYSRMLVEDNSDDLDEEAQIRLKAIIRNTERMGQLINDLLEFSRVGRTAIRTSEVNMNDLVRDALQELSTSGVPIPEQVQVENLKPALGDVNLLRQVWANLLSNAIKYSSGKKRPVIEVGMKQETLKNIYFIKDNGAGFDMKYYDKLFGVFQRLHTMQEFAGTGVGLALVRRIIVRHGGTIWGEATPGEGATFYFDLPVGTTV